MHDSSESNAKISVWYITALLIWVTKLVFLQDVADKLLVLYWLLIII